MRTTPKYLPAAAALVLFASAQARSETVPDATFELFAGEQNFTTPGTFTGSSCGGPGGGGCETDSASVTTSLVLQTNGTGSAAWSAGPDALAGVYYEVVGPGSISVPVTITGYGSVSLSGSNGYAFSQIDADIGAPAQVCTQLVSNICSGATSAGTLTQSLSVTSNTVYEFLMQTGCEVNAGTCSTYLDPTVSIDDPTLLTDGYKIELSPNIAPVPLPASAWLLLTGLLGAGAMGCKRRAA